VQSKRLLFRFPLNVGPANRKPGVRGETWGCGTRKMRFQGKSRQCWTDSETAFWKVGNPRASFSWPKNTLLRKWT